jgi:hypothetical protein
MCAYDPSGWIQCTRLALLTARNFRASRNANVPYQGTSSDVPTNIKKGAEGFSPCYGNPVTTFQAGKYRCGFPHFLRNLVSHGQT